MSAAATLGFLLNLFNMVPVVPFDGGVAAGAIHPYVWFVGIFGLRRRSAAVPERRSCSSSSASRVWQAYGLLKRYRARRRGDAALLPQHHAETADRDRVLYFGIAALLAAGYFEAAPPRPQ